MVISQYEMKGDFIDGTLPFQLEEAASEQRLAGR
jgi:hypothetical protein